MCYVLTYSFSQLLTSANPTGVHEVLPRHGNNVVLFDDAIADIDLEPIDFEHFVDDIDDGQGRQMLT